MAILKRLENYLDKNKVKYTVESHRKVYTTYDAAQTQHEELKKVAKTLLVRLDRDLAFAVIPGHRRLDFAKLKKLVNRDHKAAGEKLVKKVSLGSEALIKSRLTKAVGALAPFGGLYKIPTYWDKLLDKPAKILLNGGSFTESVVMTPAAFCRLEKPLKGDISKTAK